MYENGILEAISLSVISLLMIVGSEEFTSRALAASTASNDKLLDAV